MLFFEKSFAIRLNCSYSIYREFFWKIYKEEYVDYDYNTHIECSDKRNKKAY